MVGMADILNKRIYKKETDEKLPKTPEKEIEIPHPGIAEGKIYNKEELEKIYHIVAGFIEYIYGKVKEKKTINGKDEELIDLYIGTFVDQLLQGNDELLAFFNLSAKEIYLYDHITNVCILVIDVGIGLGYDRSKLMRLGILALLHDIGISKFYNLVVQPRKFTEDEYSKVKNSGVSTREYLSSLKDSREIIDWINSAISQESQGRAVLLENPDKKPDESIYIITIIDIYEAMTHIRPYREKIHPFEVFKELIEKKKSCEETILKVLIERIGGLYPVGTRVKMSSGEDGRVKKRNLGFLLRPVIEITHDAKGNKLKDPKIIDLIKQPTLYIKRHLKDEEIK